MASQARQQAPQVAGPQVASPMAGPGAGRSNEAAQGALAARAPRGFARLPEGTSVEVRGDADRLCTHVGALWDEMAIRGMGRAYVGPETPMPTFEESGQEPGVRSFPSVAGFSSSTRYDTGWVNAGSVGMAEAITGLQSPFAQARIEINALIGDITPVASGLGTASTSIGGTVGASQGSGVEAGLGGGGAELKVGASGERSLEQSGGASLSSQVPTSAYTGTLGFDCKVSFKRTFGPAEERSGRIVAGTVLCQSALGAPEIR